MTQGRDVTTAEIAALGNPFPGLRPFEFEESHLFFGRDGQRERLISKLAARRFLAVVGTSGSGKSSLVRAGLLPALFGGVMTGAGSAWRVALLRPGDDPFGNLARALTGPDVFRAESQEGAGVQTAIVEAILRRGCLGLIEAVRQAPLPEGENLLILVDQFEELFRIRHATQVEDYENDRVAFVKLLLEAQRQNEFPIYVALTMRSDYLGDCAQFRDLPEAINESQYLIPRLTRAERREAIAGPVAVFGGKITPRLINRLLNDMGDDPDQLPILQHALMRVWTTWAKDYGPEEPLDLCHYEVIGGWGAALSRHAEEAYDGLGAEGRRQLAAGVFKRLTEKGGDNRETRRPATLAELCAVTGAQEGEVKVVIDAFRRAGRSFLLPPAGKALVAESVIDISHESLIRGWDRLKKWAEEEAQDGEEYRRLAGTAARHREDKAELWRDRELQLALEWRDRLRPTENWARRYAPDFDLAMSFLKQSQDEEEGQRAKEEERRRLAEQDAQRRQAEARSKAFRGRVIAILVGLLAAASLFSWYAFSQRRKGQHRLYASNMALALQAKDEWNIPRIKELLDDFSPTQGGKNLRGFVWYHLWLS
ncbi:MAG TPA: hypothetical protein VFC61_04385, partial [Blastocatellia bacterium]|nr:hypothetical protein [Blastocatellia bacterium]